MQKGANMGVEIARLKLGGQNRTIRKPEGPKLQFSTPDSFFRQDTQNLLFS
jgi:hypothetical protein